MRGMKRYSQRTIEAILTRKRRLDRKRLDFSQDDWGKALIWFRFRCAVCEKHTRLTRDHWIPTSAGGAQGAANVVPLCPDCNASKGCQDPLDWLYTFRPRQAAVARQRVEAYFRWLNGG